MKCLFASVSLFGVYVGLVTGNTISIPPGMPIGEFRGQVLDKYLEEVAFVQPSPGKVSAWAASRFFIREYTDQVFGIQITGDVLESTGEIVCYNSTYKYNLTNIHSRAELRSAAGSLWVFFSSSPKAYVWGLRCRKWVVGSTECPVEKTGLNLFKNDGYHLTVPFQEGFEDLLFTSDIRDNPDFVVHYNTEQPVACNYTV